MKQDIVPENDDYFTELTNEAIEDGLGIWMNEEDDDDADEQSVQDPFYVNIDGPVSDEEPFGTGLEAIDLRMEAEEHEALLDELIDDIRGLLELYRDLCTHPVHAADDENPDA